MKTNLSMPQYIQMLQQAYTGSCSEFTSVSQYFYQHTQFEACYPEAAETLMKIAIEEMHHLELLAECITRLGGNPIFASCHSQKCTWWCGQAVNYTRSLRAGVVADIKAEHAAIRFYQLILSYTIDEEIRDMLHKIICEEQHHIALFTEILNKHQLCDG